MDHMAVCAVLTSGAETERPTTGQKPIARAKNQASIIIRLERDRERMKGWEKDCSSCFPVGDWCPRTNPPIWTPLHLSRTVFTTYFIATVAH